METFGLFSVRLGRDFGAKLEFLDLSKFFSDSIFGKINHFSDILFLQIYSPQYKLSPLILFMSLFPNKKGSYEECRVRL